MIHMPIQTLIKTNDSIFINNIYRILLFLDLKMDLISEIYFLLSFFEMPSLYFSQSDHLFVCATEQHYVSRSFTHLWSVYNSMLFKYIGGLVASDQKMAFFFSFSSLHFCLPFFLVSYLYYASCAVEILKFRNYLRVSEIRDEHRP